MRATTAALGTFLLTTGIAAADPEQGSPEWIARDLENMHHATERVQDMFTNPEFSLLFWTSAAGAYPGSTVEQLQHPTRPAITLGQLVPGTTPADPYRLDWEEQGRGVAAAIEYENRYGARITGHVWAPALPFTDPVTGTESNGPFPGIVITTGSIQAFEEVYFWAAQGLAEEGYVVMTYDVQGQGQSETFGHEEDGSFRCGPGGCPGVPSQQAANFLEGTVDALDWFLSSANPMRGLVDDTRVGLAGHSLGATAVTQVGNEDLRVSAVVAWDNANIGDVAPRIPTMGQNADYFFQPEPSLADPDPDVKSGTFATVATAGVPAMQVALRGSSHAEWAFAAYAWPASRKGERVAMYYTLAWFDRWLKGAGGDGEAAAQRASAATRLRAVTFDSSVDRSSIGMGPWDPGTQRNVPNRISGETVADHLSIYYRSAYSFDGTACADMRVGCGGS